ncbi:mitogen-activated protein kinase HOG1-like [Exaiptasia diaphana]|uniref:Protein kinase domain-containing protein n=1 Tax=Exaiptasia diaphana TaxID=2652724 RepID=A0A913X5Y9_EXADI|nr:mitogen-activated protein kinase HOG1-like [Exaiptasia diaphana]
MEKLGIDEESKAKVGARRRVHERRKRRRNERRMKRQERQNGHVDELAELQKAIEEKNEELERQQANIAKLNAQLEKEREFRKNSMQLPSVRPWHLTIGREIGKGSCGMVYAATFGKQSVVVKKLDRKQTTLNMAQTEAHFLHNLRHPSLSLLVGVDFESKSDDDYKIIMPLYSVDGSLINLLGTMLSNELVKTEIRSTWMDLLMQVTKAIAYLHRVGVLHNDLKSNNVVLHRNADKSLTAIVIDFGKASFIADGHVSSRSTKPKHIASEAKKSTSSDIFSLGCIFKDAFGLVKELHISSNLLVYIIFIH